MKWDAYVSHLSRSMLKSPIIYIAFISHSKLFSSFFEICLKNFRGVVLTVNDSTYYVFVS